MMKTKTAQKKINDYFSPTVREQKKSKREEVVMVKNEIQIRCDVILPDILIEDILSRLPVKPLGRFRCVSKSWNVLLRDPQFIYLHLNRSKQNTNNKKLMISSDDFKGLPAPVTLHQSGLTLDIQFSDIGVYGSCNGLVLLYRNLLDFDDEGRPSRNEKILLLNPSTGECKSLPEPPIHYIDGEDHPIRYGLGYSESSKDIKIVRIRSYFVKRCHAVPAEVTIYSLRSNAWKKVCASTGNEYAPYTKLAIDGAVDSGVEGGVLVNGDLHWVAVTVPDFSDFADDEDPYIATYKILAFDIEGQCFRNVQCPSFCQDSECAKVCSLDGNLCLLDNSRFSCEVWVMRDYGMVESWTKLFSIDRDWSRPLYIAVQFRPLCFTNHGEDVLLHDMHFRLHNIKKKSMKDVFILQHSGICEYRVVFYIESLLPLGA